MYKKEHFVVSIMPFLLLFLQSSSEAEPQAMKSVRHTIETQFWESPFRGIEAQREERP
jgi:hypothetical protein